MQANVGFYSWNMSHVLFKTLSEKGLHMMLEPGHV